MKKNTSRPASGQNQPLDKVTEKIILYSLAIELWSIDLEKRKKKELKDLGFISMELRREKNASLKLVKEFKNKLQKEMMKDAYKEVRRIREAEYKYEIDQQKKGLLKTIKVKFSDQKKIKDVPVSERTLMVISRCTDCVTGFDYNRKEYLIHNKGDYFEANLLKQAA